VSQYIDYVLKYATDEPNRLEPLVPGQTTRVIMVKLLPGRSLHVQKITPNLKPTAGYDSHSSPQRLEWYLFNEDQVLPAYIITVKAIEDNRTAADDG